MIEINFIFRVLIVAMIAAFALTLFAKWGWIEYAQTHAPNDFVNELFSCYFCLSWWTCVFLTFAYILLTWECGINLLIPVCATPITRKLL